MMVCLPFSTYSRRIFIERTGSDLWQFCKKPPVTPSTFADNPSSLISPTQPHYSPRLIQPSEKGRRATTGRQHRSPSGAVAAAGDVHRHHDPSPSVPFYSLFPTLSSHLQRKGKWRHRENHRRQRWNRSSDVAAACAVQSQPLLCLISAPPPTATTIPSSSPSAPPAPLSPPTLTDAGPPPMLLLPLFLPQSSHQPPTTIATTSPSLMSRPPLPLILQRRLP